MFEQILRCGKWSPGSPLALNRINGGKEPPSEVTDSSKVPHTCISDISTQTQSSDQ